MAHASLRTRTVLLAGLALSLLAAPPGAEAQSKKKEAQDEKQAPPPAAANQAPPRVGTATYRVAVTSKDADVREMTTLINARLEASWKANKLTPAPYADDYDFLRRASLDIIGRIATTEELRQYFRDPPETRRSLLIERLLKHQDYARHWANLWSNWLLTRSGDFGKGKYHEQTTTWLEDQFAQNKPYHEMVSKLLTAQGKNTDNGAVNFFLAHLGEPVPRDKQQAEGQFEMVPLTSRITRVFLGTQVQCAQCHAHPFFASLKQESFWRVNAYLRQVRREGAPMRRQAMMALPDLTLRDNPQANLDANVFYEERNGKVREKYAEFLPAPGKERGPKLNPKKVGLARREELAKHLVEHEMFPKAIVNRMWGMFFGRGFVNPIDDFNDNNQPSNPELLNELAERFKHYNYDLKKLIRWMTHSNAYHLSYVANRTNDKVEHEPLFSRMVMKSLTPEQLFESLMTATGMEKVTTPAEKKQMRDQWLGQLITNFGDDEGNEVTFNGTIVQALLMMNGRNINDAIASPKGMVARAMLSKNDVISELYLAALNRPPRARERAGIAARIGLQGRGVDTHKAAYEDLFWALLNSNEFIINH
jgi:hypothetical protein